MFFAIVIGCWSASPHLECAFLRRSPCCYASRLVPNRPSRAETGALGYSLRVGQLLSTVSALIHTPSCRKPDPDPPSRAEIGGLGYSLRVGLLLSAVGARASLHPPVPPTPQSRAEFGGLGHSLRAGLPLSTVGAPVPVPPSRAELGGLGLYDPPSRAEIGGLGYSLRVGLLPPPQARFYTLSCRYNNPFQTPLLAPRSGGLGFCFQRRRASLHPLVLLTRSRPPFSRRDRGSGF